MDITTLLARTTSGSAPTDSHSSSHSPGKGPAFTRTLAAAIAAAGGSASKTAAEPAFASDAAAEQLAHSGETPLAMPGDLPLLSSPLASASATDQLPENTAEEMDTRLPAETGDDLVAAPQLATASGPNSATADLPDSASPLATTAENRPTPLTANANPRRVREQAGAPVPASTAAAGAPGELNRPAPENILNAAVAAVEERPAFETGNTAGRGLPGAAEIPTPTSATHSLSGPPGTTAAATTVATTAPTLASLTSPLASAPWQQELGQQLQGMVQRGDGSVELHLNPRELGPLSVHLQLDDQSARAQFFSAHAAVRGAVEQAVPQLREALAEQGISLGETSVGEQRQESGRDHPADGGPGTEEISTAMREPENIGAAMESRAIDSGRVDLYA